MEEKRQVGRKRSLQAFCCQPFQFRRADWQDRTGRVWFHYLHPKVRRDPAWRDYCSQALPVIDNVSRSNVFLWPWRKRGRNYERRYHSANLALTIVLLSLCSLSGCAKKRASLEQMYKKARLDYQQGFTDEPLKLAETGYAESTRYPDLNWKFRVLTAEALNRAREFSRSLELLQPDPPANTTNEVFLQRRLAQAFASCSLKKYTDAEKLLTQAEVLTGDDQDKKAELDYIRGRCELSKNEWKAAAKYFRSISEQNVVTDPFLKAYALANLGWATSQELEYEEAIDWYNQCLAVASSLPAPRLQELALGNMGSIYAELRDLPNARKNSEDAERLASQWGVRIDDQLWLLDLGLTEWSQGQTGAAEKSLKSSRDIAHELGNSVIQAKSLHNLTLIALDEGHIELAKEYHKEAHDLGLKGADLQQWQLNQAKILAAQSDYAAAMPILQKLLQQLEDEDRQSGRTRYLPRWTAQIEMARVYAAQGDVGEANRWFQSSIDTMEGAIHKRKLEELRTAIRDNFPMFDDYVAFLISRKQYDKA